MIDVHIPISHKNVKHKKTLTLVYKLDQRNKLPLMCFKNGFPFKVVQWRVARASTETAMGRGGCSRPPPLSSSQEMYIADI